jgi:hypothetical protein
MLAFVRVLGEVWAMQSLVRLGLSLVPLLAALFVSGCKTADKQDEIDAGAAPLASVATADPLPAAPTAAPTVVAPTPTPVATTTAAKLDAGAPADAGAVKIVDAGAAANGTFKACAEKCQALLAGCAIPQIPKDGGLPQLKDPVACQAAANACVAACTP